MISRNESIAKLGQELANLTGEFRLDHLIHHVLLDFFEGGEAGLVLFFHFQDQEAVADANRVGDKAAVGGEHDIVNLLVQLAAFEAAELAVLLFGGGVGVGLGQFGELFALLGASGEVAGLLLGGGDSGGVLAFRGDEDFAQEDTVIAHEFGFVLVVVLFQFGARDGEAAADFLADDALRQIAVADFALEVFKRLSGLLAHILLEFLGIGDLAFQLKSGDVLADVGARR